MPFKPILSLALLLLSSHVAAHASSTACRATAPSSLGTSIAAIALREYAEFDGHRIDAEGRLWKFGATESEASVLLDPDTGRRDASRPGRYAWRRVWEYWRTLAQHVPGADEDRMLVVAPGLLNAPADAGTAKTYRLGELLRLTEDLEADMAEPLRQAAVRAAMNDTPWSAAFISFVMDRAGLSAAQFRYSAAHWKYVQRAFAPSPDYAWVACDPESARPAVGDLLCYSRGAAPLKRYGDWRDTVATRGIAAPAHCEVVALIDTAARKMETVGGNVLQSVARRKLKLNSAMLLSRSYDPDGHPSARNRECARDPSCETANLNMQYWSVLLKLRPGVRPDAESDAAKPGHEAYDSSGTSDRGIAREAQ